MAVRGIDLVLSHLRVAFLFGTNTTKEIRHANTVATQSYGQNLYDP